MHGSHWLVLIALVGLPWLSAKAQNSGTKAEEEPRERLPAASASKVDFLTDVQPILRNHCYECHAGETEEGGLNLAVQAKLLRGGESGAVIVPGDSQASQLIHLVSGLEADRVMPPEDKTSLSTKQIGILRAWIDQGAPWPAGADELDPRVERAKEHWAFQRLCKVQPPRKDAADTWSRTGIDLFIARQLAANRISPSAPASARMLVRRLYFDLVGLPPTPEQTRQFVADHDMDSTVATRELIDALLSSQHYGERWARHWLDVARYADSDGQESDRDRPHAYRYRDFVIGALNEDMPFDQFIRWQIAGDEYEPDNDSAVAATGFLTAGPSMKLKDTFLEQERLFNRYNELDDMISTLGQGLLGLTVGCARCHDHKYDAFSAREYYQLLSVFHSGDRISAKLPSGADGFFFQDFDVDVRTTWLFRRSDFYDRDIEVQLGFPTVLSTGRSADQFWAAAKDAVDSPESTLQRRALADWITDVDHGGGALLARVIVNRIWQHHFGHGLVRTPSDFGVRGDPPTHPELLEYLADAFVAEQWSVKSLHRKILNSAVWRQTSNRSQPGGKADAVASLREQPASPGQDAEGSRELRQLAAERSVPSQIDPQNRLLWKMPPRRLEAEAMRDAMLAVSGTLNLEAGGPGYKPYIPPEANLARNIQGGDYPKDAKDDASTRRRSVYMFHKRLVPYPLFQAFDRPDLLVSCARRQNTTVAPQAMALLNDRFVRAVADDFARRLIKSHGNDDRQIVQAAFERSFSRPASVAESEASIEFITAQTQARHDRGELEPRREAVADYCQSLFGLNEFVYVD